MAKSFPPGICAHCLGYFDSLTSDHVLPQSWYPKGIPIEFEKWQMPSCIECNKKYSKIEDYLLCRYGICLNNSNISSKGLRDKALRSMNPNVGRNKKDKLLREKRRKKLLREMISGPDIPFEATIPGFKADPKINKKDMKAIPVNADYIDSFSEKIVRGVTYIFDNKFINHDYNINFDFFDKSTATEFDNLINADCEKFNCGPALQVKRRMALDNDICGLYKIVIWDRIKIYSYVTLKELDDEAV